MQTATPSNEEQKLFRIMALTFVRQFWTAYFFPWFEQNKKPKVVGDIDGLRFTHVRGETGLIFYIQVRESDDKKFAFQISQTSAGWMPKLTSRSDDVDIDWMEQRLSRLYQERPRTPDAMTRTFR